MPAGLYHMEQLSTIYQSSAILSNLISCWLASNYLAMHLIIVMWPLECWNNVSFWLVSLILLLLMINISHLSLIEVWFSKMFNVSKWICIGSITRLMKVKTACKSFIFSKNVSQGNPARVNNSSKLVWHGSSPHNLSRPPQHDIFSVTFLFCNQQCIYCLLIVERALLCILALALCLTPPPIVGSTWVVHITCWLYTSPVDCSTLHSADDAWPQVSMPHGQ